MQNLLNPAEPPTNLHSQTNRRPIRSPINSFGRVAQLTGLKIDRILESGKQPTRVYARSLLGYWAILPLRMTALAVSGWLGIRQPAGTRAADRDESIAASNNLKLLDR
jgi:hypothetical protein